MKNNNRGDGLAIQSEKPLITKTEMILNQYHVHIDSEIGDPETYRDLVTLLFNATEADDITLYLNSPGGNLDSALAIIEGLKTTDAHARAIILGSCHSAASMITMYCHEVIILDSAHSLVHTASFGAVGNTGNVKAHTDFTVRQVEKFLHTTYDGFLTPEELVHVKAGVELWFDADEIRDRMVKRNKYLEKLIKKTKVKIKSEDKLNESN